MFLYLQLAWRNIWRNKRRTFITAASIMFAVLFASIMRATQEGSYAKMIDNIVTYYTGYAQIHKAGYWADKSINDSFKLSAQLRQLGGSLPDGEKLVPRLESFALASHGKLTRGAMLTGIDPEAEKGLTQLQSKIVEGSYLQSDSQKAVLVSEGLAKYLKVGLGDTLVLIGQGYRGANAAGKYPIAGLAKFAMPDLNNRMVFLPLKETQWFYAADSLVTALALAAPNDKAANKILPSLAQKLDSQQYELMGWREMLPELVQQIELDRAGGYIMIAILYIIIGFGILGTILMMMSERMREFGMLLAIGMKRSMLNVVVWLEILLLTFLGMLGGIVASLPIIYYFNRNPIRFTGETAEAFEKFGIEPIIPTSTDPSIYLNQALVIFIMVMLLSIYPILKIRRLGPMEAMRS